MTLNEQLEIVVITYNRADFIARTIRQLQDVDSPVRDCDITVLDNNSTDETADIVRALMEGNANLHYTKNRYNIGGNGNIAKAMELGRKKYLWVLADDDAYDWTSWNQVEQAFSQDESVICVCNSRLRPEHRTDMAYLLYQLTFLPSIIFNTKLFTDTTMRNVFDNIFIFFPHLVPIVTHVNHGGKIHLIDGTIVVECEHAADVSYWRGSQPEDLFQRSKTMSFVSGYCNVIANLKDRRLARRCFDVLINGDFETRIGYVRLFGESLLHLVGRENDMQVVDIMMQAPWWVRQCFRVVIVLKNIRIRGLLMNSWIYRKIRQLADRENSKGKQ